MSRIGDGAQTRKQLKMSGCRHQRGARVIIRTERFVEILRKYLSATKITAPSRTTLQLFRPCRFDDGRGCLPCLFACLHALARATHREEPSALRQAHAWRKRVADTLDRAHGTDFRCAKYPSLGTSHFQVSPVIVYSCGVQYAMSCVRVLDYA